MAVILSKLDEMRIRRAMKESQQNKRKEELQKRIADIQKAAEEELRKEEETYARWMAQEQFVLILEDIRESNAPHNRHEEWNDLFCMAIRMLPEERAVSRDLWLDYLMLRNN